MTPAALILWKHEVKSARFTPVRMGALTPSSVSCVCEFLVLPIVRVSRTAFLWEGASWKSRVHSALLHTDGSNDREIATAGRDTVLFPPIPFPSSYLLRFLHSALASTSLSGWPIIIADVQAGDTGVMGSKAERKNKRRVEHFSEGVEEFVYCGRTELVPTSTSATTKRINSTKSCLLRRARSIRHRGKHAQCGRSCLS